MTSLPGWYREIQRFLVTRGVFLLSGNVRDIYPLPTGQGGFAPVSLVRFLTTMLRQEGYQAFIRYDPIDGFENLENASGLLQRNRPGARPGDTQQQAFAWIRTALRETRDRHLVIIADYASRLAPDVSHLTPPEARVFTLIEKISHEILPHRAQPNGPIQCNLLILILQKENDVPSWLTYRNPGIRNIVIPLPHARLRRQMASSFLNIFPGAARLSPQERAQFIDIFVAQTERMHLRDMQAIGLLARRENIPVTRLDEAVRRYKMGVRENPWVAVRPRIQQVGKAILDKHIKGQEHVKAYVLQTLLRASLGLSGAHLGVAHDRPQGVLFFAGPTGVGKTAMARAIAELVFGDPSSMIRFDMSEFTEPHTDQRLIGAPPGYVGYEQGGELTNAIKENPFSLLLFDEIEKAHPRIFDIFLQILDDGRLTDARGQTVYFSDSLIVFTSNLGVYQEDPHTGQRRPLVTPDDDVDTVRSRILEAIENFFRYRLGRPEIFNRIGRDNVLVFDFIRPPVAEAIFQKFLDTFRRTVRTKLGIELQVSEATRRHWLQQCLQPQYLLYGGRGIAQAFEVFVIQSLTQLLLQAQKEGRTHLEV